MHHKILTADNLAARGMQHNQFCALCNAFPETGQHLLKDCTFTKSVLRYIWAWFQLGGNPPLTHQSQGNADWLALNSARATELHQRDSTGILLYCWWNIWKERNRRVFDSIQRNVLQVVLAAKKEIELYRLAFRVDSV
jgi:hypothetical protein